MRIQAYFHHILVIFAIIGCSGGSPEEAGTGVAGDYTFTGVETVSPNDDGTWTVWWNPIVAGTEVTYHVFKKEEGGAYDFDRPLKTTQENFVVTEDLKLVGNTCFIVRVEIEPGVLDTNETEGCTNHEAYQFDGIDTLTSLKDGSYILKWKAPPFKGGSFQISSRTNEQTEFLPLALTSDSFFKTEPLALDEIRCYIVRFILPGFPEDTNTKSVCTLDAETLGFDGITSVESPGSGQLLVKWEANSTGVAGYNIYFDSGFKQKVATINDPSATEYLVSDLLHAVVYTVGVRAFDKDGREDANTRVVTYELLNHITDISSVEITPTRYKNSSPSLYPKPLEIICNAEYSDSDTWQTLTPTFVIKNTKRDIDEVIERLRVVGEPGQTSVTYTVSDDDDRADTLTCEVLVNDGFDDSLLTASDAYIVPDTPVQATDVVLTALENGEIDITLARGAGDGYTDEDRDDAVRVEISAIQHGTFITAEENVPLDQIFSCTNGACVARFKLEQDFFTNNTSATPELAQFDYKIFAGDNSADGQVRITVTPRPRALAFDIQVNQEELFLSKMGKLRIPADPSTHPVVQAKSYSDGNDGLATTAFYRQPLANNSNKGRVLLPNPPDTLFDYLCEVADDKVRCTYGDVWADASCSYNIIDGANLETLQSTLSDVYANGDWIGVTYRAARPGANGNLINLTFDGSTSIAAIVEAWNAANPDNPVTHNAADENATPSAGSLTLAGGIDMGELLNEVHYTGTEGYIDNNFECTIPCETDGTCNYGYIAHPGFYGPDVEFDFAVEVGSIQSNYAAARIIVLPNLRATGYKGLTVQGQTNFQGIFAEGMGIAGLDESFTITSFEVDPASIENLNNVSVGSIDNTALEVPFTAEISSNTFKGIGKFSYRITASQANKSITSNWATAEIEFYPIPQNTGFATSAIENRGRTIQIRNGDGYLFTKSPPVNQIEFDSIIRGTFTREDTSQISNLDIVSCSVGECTFDYMPETDFWDFNAGEHIKFRYRLTAMINTGLFTGDDPQYFIDAYLENPANHTLVSDWSDGIINVRPTPKLRDMKFFVKEAHPHTIDDPDASVELFLDLADVITKTDFDTLGALDTTYAYFHPQNLPATEALLGSNFESGTVTGFDCVGNSGSQPKKYSCFTNYTPAIGIVAVLQPVEFTMAVTDPEYTLNNGKIESDPKEMTVEIRPIPKAKPENGLTLAIKENTTFNPSLANISLARGEETGYTHVLDYPAVNLSLSESSTSNGAVSVPGIPCNGIGTCTGTWTPNQDYYGVTELRYRVAVDDPYLPNEVFSTKGIYTIDVRPLPRAQNIGTIGTPRRVIENETEEIHLDLDLQYTHAYNTPCSGVEIVSITNGNTVISVNGTLKRCTIAYTPDTDFEGPVEIAYKVKVQDDVLGEEVESNQATIYLDVFPKPRTAGRQIYVLPNTQNPVTLDLRVNSEITPSLDENEAGIALNDRKGYAHRRDGKVSIVKKVAEPARGTLGNFTCTTAGLCTATFDSPGYQFADPEVFKYTVSIEGVESNQSDYNIKILPALIPDANRTVATIEDVAIEVDFKKGAGLGYFSPEGDNAHRIEIVASNKGAASVQDLDIGDAGKNCNTSGDCKVTFTPESGYFNPDTASNEAWFDYKLYSYTGGFASEIESAVGRVVIKVRPRPIAVAKVDAARVAQIQGVNWDYVFAKGSDLLHPYEWDEPTIQIKEIKITDPLHGTPDKTTINCITGSCETFSFVPDVDGNGDAWYTLAGQYAEFEYKVVIYDNVLEADIESLPAKVTIDYRPRPKAFAQNFIGWQNEDLTVSIEQGDGYDHPYFPLDDNVYQVSKVNLQAVPDAGSEGAFLSAGFEFDCDINDPKKPCNGVFRPDPDYYYDPAGTKIDFTFTLTVNDPVIGEIESYPQTSTLEIRPTIVNVGKTVWGVQSVDKNMSLWLDDGFTYPLGSLPQVPQIVIRAGSKTGTTADIIFDCSSETNCEEVFELSGNDIYGENGFEYAVVLNDPDLGLKQSAWADYTINFFPRPVGKNLVGASLLYTGEETQDRNINLIPENATNQTYCESAHSALEKTGSYQHPYCTPVVEVFIDDQTNATFDANFNCDAKGRCQGNFVPNVKGGSWPGYGIASFKYRVRIDPDELSGVTLTAAEEAALTSDVKTAEVEYYPIPWTNGLTSGPYLYAVQDKNISLSVTKCAGTDPTLCFSGYTQGYDEDADQINISDETQLTTLSSTCVAGVCNLTLVPTNGFYSTDPSDLAQFDYSIDIGPRTSNKSTVKFNVYPLPEAKAMTFEGIEGEDITITIDKPTGYEHAFDLDAEAIQIVVAPQATASTGVAPGKFVVSGNTVEPNADLSSVFTCTDGSCSATFRSIGGAGSNSFQFAVQINGPADMPQEIKDQLTSKPAGITLIVHPKPIATPLEVVVVENVSGGVQGYKPFRMAENSGYTHVAGKQATEIHFDQGTSASGNDLVFTDAKLLGIFTCDSGTTDCNLGCTGGNCDASVQPDADYSSTMTDGGACTAGTCPSLDFAVTVAIDASKGLYAKSDNTAKLTFNVRPRPKASTDQLATYIAEEGEIVTIDLSNGSGYSHQWYDANEISNEGTTNGSISAFDCTISGNTICRGQFTPNPAFVPGPGDDLGTLSYKVSIDDPTDYTDGALGGGAGKVGALESEDTGSFTIKYRPYPIVADLDLVAVEDDTDRYVDIQDGNGFFHGFNLLPSNITIVAGTVRNMTITPACDGVNLATTDCTFACSAGACRVEYVPTPGYAGTDAGFDFKVSVLDTEFPTDRELFSQTAATVDVDVRPKPSANNINLAVLGNENLAISISKGDQYNHTLNYNATGITLGAISNGQLASNGSDVDDSFNCSTGTAGECATTFIPGTNYYGYTNITYQVAVYDAVLDSDQPATSGIILSAPKTIMIDVRPLPEATGYSSNFVTLENQTKSMVIDWGTSAAKLGWAYPVGEHASYDIYPKAISIEGPPDPSKGNLSGPFVCNTTGDRSCAINFVPTTDTYGTTNLDYEVQIQDLVLSQLIDSNMETINIDVRPLLRLSNPDLINQPSLKAIENITLNWSLNNGTGKGFIYPLDAAYSAALDTLSIEVRDLGSGGNGSVQAGATCASGACSGDFIPTNNHTGPAGFEYRLSLTDTALPVGSQVQTTDWQQATIDVYPRPEGNDLHYYAREGDSLTVTLARGVSSGYTHARNDNASFIDIVSLTNIDNVTTGAFDCTAGTCTGELNLTPGFESVTNGNADAAILEFNPNVTESGPDPRTAEAKLSSDVFVHVYPKAVPVPVAANHTNKAIWADATESVTIARNAGYTHSWTGSDGEATDIILSSVAGGSVGAVSCTDGSCSFDATPDGTAFQSNAMSFNYKVETSFANLTPPVTLSNDGSVSFNVRPHPYLPAATPTVKVVENAPVDPIILGQGPLYRYGDLTLIDQVDEVELKVNSSSHANCTPSSCLGEANLKVGSCSATGDCTLPNIALEADWNRTLGASAIQYRVVVNDSELGERKTDWADLNLDIIPMPRGEEIEFEDGIQDQDYDLTISLTNGYNHPENELANKIKIVSLTNVSGYANDEIINCNAAGECSLTVTPEPGAFTSYAGRSKFGNGFGWAKITYQVRTTIEGFDIWSDNGTAEIRFRALPKPYDITIANAIEDEAEEVNPCLKKTTNTPCSTDYIWGYTNAENLAATGYRIENLSAGTATIGICSAQGDCDLDIYYENYGTVTADLYVTTGEGVEQKSPSKLNITFLARPRAHALTASVVEGETTSIVFNSGEANGFTHAGGLNIHDIIVRNIAKGTITQDDNGACTSLGGGAYRCDCESGSQCTLKYTPSAWDGPDDTPLAGSFEFEPRVLGGDYAEKNGDPLKSKNKAAVSIEILPRIKTNSRDYPSGTTIMGVQGQDLTFTINKGAAGFNTGGYIHNLNQNATEVEIVTQNGLTTQCGGLPCNQSCSNGVCTVTVSPLSGGSFQANASLTYKVYENSFESHKNGTSDIYFYPRPIGIEDTAVVVQGSTGNTLTMRKGFGYSQANNDNASSWKQNGSITFGTLSTWGCSSGNCTVSFTPNPGIYSTSETDLFEFDYDVATNPVIGPVWSTTKGTFKIEVFPLPTAIAKTVYWVEGVGNPNASGGNQYRLTIAKNDAYTHPRSLDATKITYDTVVGGTFNPSTNAFSCSGGTCSATFNPSAVSSSFSSPASTFDFKVGVGGADYQDYLSDPETYGVVIYPKPSSHTFTATTTQRTSSIPIRFANTTDAATSKYYAFSHSWGSTPSTNDADITLTNESPTVGSFSTPTCNGSYCETNFTPINGETVGTATFKFSIRTDYGSNNLKAFSSEQTAYVNVNPAISTNGRLLPDTEQQVVGNVVQPTTEVKFTIAKGGTTGYTTDPTSLEPQGIIFTGAKIGKDPAFLNNVSVTDLGGGTWRIGAASDNLTVQTVSAMSSGSYTGKIVASNYQFGYIKLNYRVCMLAACTPGSVISPPETSTSKWVEAYIDPSDFSPIGCTKNGTDSVIAYTNRDKEVLLDRVPDGANCENGKWYMDANDGDLLTSYKFLGVHSSISITGLNGTASCSKSGSTHTCTCTSHTAQDCSVKIRGTTNGTYGMRVIPTTRSLLLGIDTEGDDPGTNNVTIKVVTPLKPEPKNFTFQVFDDPNYVNPLEDQIPAIDFIMGQAFKSPTEINAGYLPAPDGYDMIIEDIVVNAFDASKFDSLTSECNPETEICSLTPNSKWDANGATNVTFSLVANGQTSDTTGIVSMTIDPVDDPPMTYSNGVTDILLHKDHRFAICGGTNCLVKEGTFFDGVNGKQIEIKLFKTSYEIGTFNQNNYWYQRHGYYDQDGDLATSITVDNGTITGGTLDTAFTCDGSGVCTALWTPTQSGWGSFKYKVTTNGADGAQTQPLWSDMKIYAYASLDNGGTYDIDAEHLPTGTEDPDTTVETWFDTYADFTVGRNKSKTLVIRKGNAPGDAYAASDEWMDIPDVDYATSIEFGDGTNGAPAPVNLTVDPASFTCNNGACIGSVSSLETYAEYPAEGSLWYRVISAENFEYQGFDFENYLSVTSDWKRITYKIQLNVDGSCEDVPQLTGSNIAVLEQGGNMVVTVGAGGAAGAFYDHTGTNAEWRPLGELEVVGSRHATATTPVCGSGICTFTLSAEGSGNSDPADDYVPSFLNGPDTDPGARAQITLRATDDTGCSTVNKDFGISIRPRITTRNLCKFDNLSSPDCIQNDIVYVNPGQTSNIEFRKRNTNESTTVTGYAHYTQSFTDYNDYEYETSDNSKATSIKLSNFRAKDGGVNVGDLLPGTITNIVSGAGVSCTGATAAAMVCTIPCDGNGDCAATMNSGSGHGMLAFDYVALVGTQESRGIYTRVVLPNTGITLEQDFYGRTSRKEVYVKAKPVTTNLTKSTVPNSFIDIVIGENAGVGEGFNYADAAILAGQIPVVTTSNAANGSILSSTYNSGDKTYTIRFQPDTGFIGTASFDFGVSVFGVNSDSSGTVTINVESHLQALDTTYSVVSNTTSNSLNIEKGVGEEYNNGNLAGTGLAITFQIQEANGDAVPGAEFTLNTCNGSGVCNFEFTPATDFVGTRNLRFRIQGTDGGSQTWSNWADMTIDVTNEPTAPVVSAINLTGKNTEEKLIAIMADSGYSDVNDDLATTLHITSVIGGTLSPAGPDIACTDGVCLVGFTRNPGEYGNASFDFQVTAGGDLSSNTETVTVDFVPQLVASDINENGVRGTNKAISLILGNGYEFAPGALVTDMNVTSITNGTVVGGNTISCSSGICNLTVAISNDGGVTESVLEYDLAITGGLWDGTASNTGTITIAVAQTDTAPVALTVNETLPTHAAYDIVFEIDTAYTDTENDQATALSIVAGSLKGGTLVDKGCVSGTCTQEFTPTAGYHGDAGFSYTVTANGLESNEASVFLTVPTDASMAFDLSWTTAPTLDATCKITVPGQVDSGTVNTFVGVFGASLASGAVTADNTGMSAIATGFDTNTMHYVTWQGDEASETVRLGKYLQLASAAPSTLVAPKPSATRTTLGTMPGMQASWDGCTGNSCDNAALPASIASGENFSCTMMANSTVYCWGENGSGQLGRDTVVDSEVPDAVRLPSFPSVPYYGLAAVTAGAKHACALTTTQEVVCWGDNEFGQLGDGNSGGGSYSDLPVEVINQTNVKISNIVAVSAGAYHTCALDATGKAFCWGQNTNGQLGDGTTGNSAKAVNLKKDNTTDFSNIYSISSGLNHSCLLESDGTNPEKIYCWGANGKRQIGDYTDTGTDRLYPSEVKDGTNNPLSNPLQIAAGNEFSCALLDNNKVYCWGDNASEQTGVSNGTTNPSTLYPNLVGDVTGGQPADIVRIDLGDTHACALLANQTATCWGAGANGRLGDGQSTDSHIQVEVSSNGSDQSLAGIRSLSVGSNHSCAVVSGGNIYCWGANTSYALGNTGGDLTYPSEKLKDVSSSDLVGALQQCTAVYSIAP